MTRTSVRRLTAACLSTLTAGALATGATALAGIPAAAAQPTGTAPPAATTAVPAAATGAVSPDATTEPVGGLTLHNSFVSAVGWVKPGDDYPSRVILTNTAALPSAPATVTVAAPRGTTFGGATSATGAVTPTAGLVTWTVPALPGNGTATLVLEHRARTLAQEPTLVWRDLSTTATLTVGADSASVLSHGPKVIPPGEAYDTARYGDRPFPVVPVAYTDRGYQAGHTGDQLEGVINSPDKPGSTYNLYQEMSLGQLHPHGTVPSAGVAARGFDYAPGFDFHGLGDSDPTTLSTCVGATFADTPAVGTPVYPDRIKGGVYQLPGTTGYYGSDGAGSAVIGSLTGVGALMQIDSGCGPTAKIVWDAAAIADPEIDYSDFDTDKDGVVDFFMAVFAGCGGNGASQLSLPGDPLGACPYGDVSNDNVWPHSSSLEFSYTDPATGLAGFTTDDQLKDLEGKPLWYTDTARQQMTTTDMGDALTVFVRVGPYNLNPETAIDKASVISHEYGHSLGLPDFYSLGSRETYGDWTLMATDKSQDIDAFGRQELGWVVPQVLDGDRTVTGWKDSKTDIDRIVWQQPDGTPYTLVEGADGRVQNSEMYVAKLPGRVLLDPAKFETGDGASATHAWWSQSGNDFGCATDGKGRNIDLAVPGLKDLPAGSTVTLDFRSMFDVEWDYDYGFVLTSTDGGQSFTSRPSTRPTGQKTTTASTNPNQNACQTTFGNGITGSSASYTKDAVSLQLDRTLGTYDPSVFIADRFDISNLAGAEAPVLRFSYSTDPGLARPGWFIDDVKVTATTPAGDTVLLATDFESDGGPDDPRVFNGGCQPDSAAQNCTKGWQYVNAGSEAPNDHAYYLEMRDRSGFDVDGHGQIDRDPIGFQAGLYVAYTDESHGYGNVGTDNPPAQTPLDSQPEPGSDTPDLDDAAWTAAAGDSSFTDSGEGHTENYSDPAQTEVDSRYAGVANPWRFRFGCLAFDVLSMAGTDVAPVGNLTGNVAFDIGAGCGEFDHGYGDVPSPPANTAPTAAASATPAAPTTKTAVTLVATGSTDAETPGALDYSWDFGNGGTTKDASGAVATHTFPQAGTYTATVTVTDPEGLTDTAAVTVTVTKAANRKPVAKLSTSSVSPMNTSPVVLSAAGSADEETRTGDLAYAWDFGDGGSTVDATGPRVRTTFRQAGRRTITLTVTDGDGASATTSTRITVRREIACLAAPVTRTGSWRSVRRAGVYGGSYCDNLGTRPGADTLRTTFSGDRLDVFHGRSTRGGSAAVYVDGVKVGTVTFRSEDTSPALRYHRVFTGLGSGTHTVRLVVTRGRAYVDGFIVYA